MSLAYRVLPEGASWVDLVVAVVAAALGWLTGVRADRKRRRRG